MNYALNYEYKKFQFITFFLNSNIIVSTPE